MIYDFNDVGNTLPQLRYLYKRISNRDAWRYLGVSRSSILRTTEELPTLLKATGNQFETGRTIYLNRLTKSPANRVQVVRLNRFELLPLLPICQFANLPIFQFKHPLTFFSFGDSNWFCHRILWSRKCLVVDGISSIRAFRWLTWRWTRE